MAGSNSEQIPPGIEKIGNALPADVRAQIVECIKYLREHPEPDGKVIFDIPIYPAMFRSMKCHGYAITFRMQDHQVLIHTIVEDGG